MFPIGLAYLEIYYVSTKGRELPPNKYYAFVAN